MYRNFIIDFDSTFVKVEALDELARISLEGNPRKEKISQEIKKITKSGMNGMIPFDESLQKRLKLFNTDKNKIKELVDFLKQNISASVLRNKDFFKQYKNHIYVISGGFEDYIVPVVKEFGIEKNKVLANSFIFDKKGIVVGLDKKSDLAYPGGKVKALQKLDLKGEVCIIGDGYTDYEMKASNTASQFYAFVENVKRDIVIKKADFSITSFDELLFHLDLPRRESYPKSKMKVLLLENIDKLAVEFFKQQGYVVEHRKEALSEKELTQKIADISILGIRSKTEITPTVLTNANRLHAIGAFCIGTNQISLVSASEHGWRYSMRRIVIRGAW